MSSFPGYEVADFVRDAFMHASEEQIKHITSIYMANPELRECIEIGLDRFEPDEQSWRDYRYSIQDLVNKEFPEEKELVDSCLEEGKQ